MDSAPSDYLDRVISDVLNEAWEEFGNSGTIPERISGFRFPDREVKLRVVSDDPSHGFPAEKRAWIASVFAAKKIECAVWVRWTRVKGSSDEPVKLIVTAAARWPSRSLSLTRTGQLDPESGEFVEATADTVRLDMERLDRLLTGGQAPRQRTATMHNIGDGFRVTTDDSAFPERIFLTIDRALDYIQQWTDAIPDLIESLEKVEEPGALTVRVQTIPVDGRAQRNPTPARAPRTKAPQTSGEWNVANRGQASRGYGATEEDPGAGKRFGAWTMAIIGIVILIVGFATNSSDHSMCDGQKMSPGDSCIGFGTESYGYADIERLDAESERSGILMTLLFGGAFLVFATALGVQGRRRDS